MTVSVSPVPFQCLPSNNNTGVPAAGFKLFTYIAGTSTKQNTWVDSTQTTLNANPILLDANGYIASTSGTGIWLDPTLTYKFVLALPTDTDPPGSPLRTQDNVQGMITLATLTAGFIGSIIYPRTAAEIAASVTPTNYAYPPFDLRRYGADPTGVAASDTAMTNAILVCGTTGGTIRAPAGTYKFASTINCNLKNSIVIQGDGTVDSGAQTATYFQFTPSGSASFFTMAGAQGVELRNLQIVHTNSGYTGTYVVAGNTGGTDSSFCGVYNCTFGANVGTGNGHLNLDKTTAFTAERCTFQRGSPSVQGQAHAGSSYSNAIKFRDCEWFQNYVAPIQDLGQGWLIEGCVFENLTTGAPGALLTNPFVTLGDGLTVAGCWFGDATATVGTWISGYFVGSAFIGNYISGNATGTTDFSLAAPSGVVIKGNTFDTALVAVNFQSGGGGGHGNDISGNFLTGVVTFMTNSVNTDAVMVFNPNSPVQGAPNAKQGVFSQNGMEISPNGIIRQWGFVSTITIGTPLTVSFPVAFLNNCWTVVATISGSSGTANTLFVDTVGTSSFRGVANGTAGTDSFYWQAVGN